jgi:hypothetical protein
VLVVLQIESKANFLLCSESIVVFLIPLFATMHLFVDLLLFVPMTTTLM